MLPHDYILHYGVKGMQWDQAKVLSAAELLRRKRLALLERQRQQQEVKQPPTQTENKPETKTGNAESSRPVSAVSKTPAMSSEDDQALGKAYRDFVSGNMSMDDYSKMFQQLFSKRIPGTPLTPQEQERIGEFGAARGSQLRNTLERRAKKKKAVKITKKTAKKNTDRFHKSLAQLSSKKAAIPVRTRKKLAKPITKKVAKPAVKKKAAKKPKPVDWRHSTAPAPKRLWNNGPGR